MRLRKMTATLAIAMSVAGSALAGCDVMLTPTKVADGQLYRSGDSRYDAYFAAIHQEQEAASRWLDDARAARKPIVTALELRPGASNGTILAATRGKEGDASLSEAVEQTTAAERARARRLRAAATKLDKLWRRGTELKKQTFEDRKNLGAAKADAKKLEAKDEVKREMSAAVDAASSMANNARKAAKEAEELAMKLKAAWTGRREDERSKPATPPDEVFNP